MLRLRLRWLLLMSAPAALLLGLFFALPLASVMAEAFGGGGEGFSRVLRDPMFWKGLRGSLALSLAAGTLSLGVGFFVAQQLARLGAAARTLLLFLISLPLTFSGLIVAYGFILVFGRAGFVTLSLESLGVNGAVFAGFIYSPSGLACAYSYYLIPRVVLFLLPVLVNFDKAQLAAAETLGAGRFRVLWDVLLPQVMPAALGAFTLVVAVALGAYGTALALVGTQLNILPLLLYSKISDTGSDFPAAAALSVLLLALCSCVMGAGEWVAGRRNPG